MSSRKDLDQLNQGVSNINLGSSEGGAWEEVARKQKNRAGASSGRQWIQQPAAPKAWGRPDTAQRLGMRQPQSNNVPGASAVAPQVERGFNMSSRNASTQVREEQVVDEDDDKEEEELTDDDDDLLSDDSDEAPLTHDSRKQHRMLKGFFDILDKLTVQEINEPARQWHCPACQGGPGAIDWYKGLQPLITHARTKGSQRVKLHREFASLLDEELRRRGTSFVPAGESFGQWEGLKQEIKDHEIVWPPMVLVMNTILEKDDTDKWLGMGNQELLDYFHDYAAVRARHSYGPKGHRGISILIFESSAMGYVEAERLHKHFLGQGTGRNAWESNRRALFYPGGKRQLYGFIARKDDLDEFNRHCQGKTKLKFEMRSYQEMVVTQMKQMSEDNQLLTWFKDRVVKQQQNSKALEESLNIVSQKLRKTLNENRIVRERTKIQHEQNKEEMDYLDNFYKDQLKQINDETLQKEEKFEKLQQDERKKVEHSNAAVSDKRDHRRRAEEITKFKEFQEQEMEKFEKERDELIRIHEAKILEMRKRHWEEEVVLKKEFDSSLMVLMDKYAPKHAEVAASSDA